MTIFTVLMYSAATFAGTGAKPTAFDTRSLSLAGATSANMNSIMALENNPSQLFFIGKDRVEFNMTPAIIGINYTDSFQGTNWNNDNSITAYAPLTNLGYVYHYNDKLVLGIVGYVNGGVGMKMEDIKLGIAPNDGSEDIDFSMVNFKVSFGGAYQLNDNLTLGVSLDWSAAKLKNKIDVTGITNKVKMISVDYQPDLAQTAGFNFGLTYKIRNINLAYCYSSSNSFDFNGELILTNLNGPAPVTGKKYDNTETSFTMPERHTIAASYAFNEAISLMGEFRYQPYKKYFMTQDLKSNGAAVLPQQKPRYDDLKFFGVGIEYQEEGFVLRGGYGHGNGICGPESVSPTNIFVNTDDLTFGAGTKWNQYEFNLGLLYSIPKSVKAAPDADWSTAIFNQPAPSAYSYEIKGDLLVIGFTTIYNF